MSTGDILMKRDLAELLQVSGRTVERWMAEDRFPISRFPSEVPGRRHGSFEQKFSSGCESAQSSLYAVPMEWHMPRVRRKLPKGIHVHESGSVYICYKNEHGKIIRENTHQTDVRAAELILAQARTDVAMKRRFTSLSFENVKFIDLFNDWWSNHGSRTRSKFE